MTGKYYQVINFQHQPVKTFVEQTAAEKHIDELRKVYPDEGFYVIELNVVYSIGEIE